MRKWLILTSIGAVLGVLVVVYSNRQMRNSEREVADARIAAEMDKPIAEFLSQIHKSDPLFAIAGKFQSWRPNRHCRLPFIDWNHSYLLISGTAKFEKADVPVSVSVYRGPLDVTSGSQTKAQWLAEHPEQGVAIVNRRITISEKYAKSPPAEMAEEQVLAANDPDLLVATGTSSEGYPNIDIEGRHPQVVEED